MRLRTAITALALGGCVDLADAEDWQPWFDGGAALDVEEPVTFSADPVEGDCVSPGDQGWSATSTTCIADLRDAVLTSPFDNDGPLFAEADFPAGAEDCQYWAKDATGFLPAEIEGVVTSHPRVYRKIEGCDGDEKYYGSFWMEDATGGVFVLGNTKVAHFDMGDRVRLKVRAMRRRYAVDMVYVHDVVDIDTSADTVPYEAHTGPIGEDLQSSSVRVSGTVVTAASTFGEVLLQPDGYDAGTCGPADHTTRQHCLVATVDQELGKRGVTLPVGEHVTLTGPVAQTAFFSPAGVFNFYGVYLTRIGQIERMQAAD